MYYNAEIYYDEDVPYDFAGSSGWRRLWLAEETQRQLDIRNAKREDAEVIEVKKVIKAKKKRKKVSREIEEEEETGPFIPWYGHLIEHEYEPSMAERIGSMQFFTEYSKKVYDDVVVRREEVQAKRRKKIEEEDFIILALDA